MASVRIEIVRSTHGHQPGFVECWLTDINGRVWIFEEKVPVVCEEYLGADSQYPRVGFVGCIILRRDGDVVRVGVDPLSDDFECDVLASAIGG